MRRKKHGQNGWSTGKIKHGENETRAESNTGRIKHGQNETRCFYAEILAEGNTVFYVEIRAESNTFFLCENTGRELWRKHDGFHGRSVSMVFFFYIE